MKTFRKYRRGLLLLLFSISCSIACSETLSVDVTEDKLWYGEGCVQFSCPHGVYKEALLVEMKPRNGGVIHYTLDGNTPTIYSPSYYNPLLINSTVIIRALEEVDGVLSSIPSTITYIYPESVVIQPNEIEGYPQKWGPYATVADTAIADYGMDPDLRNDIIKKKKKSSIRSAICQ